MLVEIITFDEFKQKHGEGIWIKERFLFPDGAQSDGQGSHREPPRNEIARITLQREFLKYRHDRLEKQFKDLYQNAADAYKHFMTNPDLPPPNPEAPRALSRLRDLVHKDREAMAAIDEKLANTPENQHRQRQIEMRNAKIQEATETINKLREISL